MREEELDSCRAADVRRYVTSVSKSVETLSSFHIQRVSFTENTGKRVANGRNVTTNVASQRDELIFRDILTRQSRVLQNLASHAILDQ